MKTTPLALRSLRRRCLGALGALGALLALPRVAFGARRRRSAARRIGPGGWMLTDDDR